MKPILDILLGVNIDHVATLRQARGTRYPDPIQAAIEAEQAGADSITLHLREDRRHIQERDVEMLKDILLTHMNLEMAATDEMVAIAERIKPTDCCLVPERREELTTEGGLDVLGHLDRITDVCACLKEACVKVSLFIEADLQQIEAAVRAGAILQKISNYSYQLAIIGDFSIYESESLQAFIRESNRTGQVIFVPDLETAIGRFCS